MNFRACRMQELTSPLTVIFISFEIELFKHFTWNVISKVFQNMYVFPEYISSINTKIINEK